MTRLLTSLRLPLLAALLTLSLTSCFDHDKKCDPKPKQCGKGAPPTTTPGGTI